MVELLTHVVDAPLANILILAGLGFLAVAVIGNFSGKIEPGTAGRFMSGALGLVLLIYGIYSHAAADQTNAPPSGPPAAAERPKPPAPPIESVSEPVSSFGNENRSPEGGFTGTWKNDNPQTRGITKLEVRRSANTLLVHAWAACSPQDCDWGTERAAVSGNSATVAWDQGSVVRTMTLVRDQDRLHVLVNNVFKDNRPPRRMNEYFVR